MILQSKKRIFLLALILVVVAIPIYLYATYKPFIEIILFSRFNAFEFEGEEVGTIERDIIYKSVDGQSLMVDLYMPFERRHPLIPVLVYSHGGGWVIGDRTTMLVGPDNRELIIRLRELGYAIANFEFRLVGEDVTVADAIEDNKDMIRWLRMNADRYELDPDNIGIWGQSGGGHLALLAGFSDDDDFAGDESLQDTSARVNYVVNNYGSADMEAMFGDIASGQRRPNLFERLLIANMFEASFDDDPEGFREGLRTIDPLAYIDRSDPPVITVHGELDDAVLPEVSRGLHRALDTEGPASELHIIENAGHIFMGATPEQIEEIVSLSADFIVRNTTGTN